MPLKLPRDVDNESDDDDEGDGDNDMFIEPILTLRVLFVCTVFVECISLSSIIISSKY